MIIIFSWFFVSFLIAFVGIDRKIGYFGSFFLCLILSPIIGLIITISSKRKSDEVWQKKVLETNKTSFSGADELIKLKKLLDDGIITSEEFETQKSKLLSK